LEEHKKPLKKFLSVVWRSIKTIEEILGVVGGASPTCKIMWGNLKKRSVQRNVKKMKHLFL